MRTVPSIGPVAGLPPFGLRGNNPNISRYKQNMNPFERVHELIISGNVIGPDGSWISRTEALKEKRAILQHILSGEVNINGVWTRLSDVGSQASSRLSPPPPARQEYEKETAIMPPPQLNRETMQIARRVVPEQPPAAMPPPLPQAQPPIEPPPPIAAPQRESVVISNDHAGHRPFSHLSVDNADAPSPPHHLKTVADSTISRPPLMQTDHAAPLVLPDENIDIRRTFVTLPVKDEPPLHAAPPQEPPKAIPATPARNISPLAKLDQIEGAKKELPEKAAAVRTIPLGKGASLSIAESDAAGALVAVCTVEGFIDQSNADTFHQQLMTMLEFGVRFFIIDFGRTVLVGSAGWGTLAVAARMVKMSGGRLLICSMKPEIAESFHLLQFNDVIDARPAVPDCIGTIREIIESQPVAGAFTEDGTTPPGRPDESFAELPLPEKIRAVISRHGPLSLFQIAAHLKGELYGKIKIGPLKLYFVLKDLNLETHWKRVRYYRSC